MRKEENENEESDEEKKNMPQKKMSAKLKTILKLIRFIKS